MEKNYVVYHLHSMLSNGVTNIDSVTKYTEYIDYAKSLNMKALAFSEHGCIFEWVHKKEYIEKCNMKYIHSSEVYLTEDNDIENKHRDNYHCVLIAKNYDGVKELNKLISNSFNRNDYHYYYAPRITFDELFNTSDNIIITSACLGGVLNNGNNDIKKKFLQFLIKNKHRSFLEIQHHNCKEQISYNKILYTIHQKTNIPLIAGTDTHCLNEEHVLGRSILQKSKDVRFENEEMWDLTFKTYDELVNAYEIQNSLPKEVYIQAIENTNIMADMIEPFELDYSHKYPKLYSDSEKVFKEKILKGIKKRGIDKYDNFDEYKKRIQYEFDTYKHNGAIDFMLLEEDYKSALKEQGVSFGYSRGSVSGSVIAYILGITEVDSIKYNLNFERFMNQERVSLADVDTDWGKKDRYKVRQYLFNKKGLYCCDIITFNTIALKGAIKDIGRALGMSVDETQKISDAVYKDENKADCIDEEYKEKYPELFKYVDIVKGTIVSIGNHPAGLVVSPYPVDEWFGLCSTKTNEHMISQINMKEIDGLSFVKLDVLGLDCVGLINDTCDLANIPRITPDNIPFDDMKVWNEIKEDCTMIFQFESPYAGEYIKQLFSDETIKNIKSNNENFTYIELMAMANGAIRPAGASYRDELSKGIFRDNGHKALNDFLSPTLGFLVYQEQVLGFLNQFCGYTMGEGDLVRRSFAKKLGTENHIPKIKDGFIKTMKDKYNVEEEESEKLVTNFIQVIIDASNYLFSLNHAIPYSFLGYAVGYLRCYYKLETVTTALNTYEEDNDKCLQILDYANRHNIKILPIKFGKSLSQYTMDKENNNIYKGISCIKYCNSTIAEELMELSKNKKYNNFVDLLYDIKNISVDSRQLKILIILNFFSDFGNNEYLLKVNDIFDKLNSAKILKKSKIEELGIEECLVKKYSNKETATQYRELDNKGLINAICSTFKNNTLSIKEQIKAEMEYLGYTTYTNSKINEQYYIVINYMCYKDVTRPYFTLRNINNGEEIKTRITQSKVFKQSPFGEYSILKVEGFTEKFKKKNIGGSWVESDEIEKVLDYYEVIV